MLPPRSAPTMRPVRRPASRLLPSPQRLHVCEFESSQRVEDSNVILRWRPNVEPHFYSYEVYSITACSPEKLVSPMPLRSAMWVDTAPPPGTRSYAVRAMTASGIRSNLVKSDPIMIRDF